MAYMDVLLLESLWLMHHEAPAAVLDADEAIEATEAVADVVLAVVAAKMRRKNGMLCQ